VVGDGAAHPNAGSDPTPPRRPPERAAIASPAARRSAPAAPGEQEACGAAGWARICELQT
jgi:hypothetical protein